MCGDFDEQERIDEELFERFLELGERLGIVLAPSGQGERASLELECERAAYLDRLFKSGLARCINDAGNLPYGERMDAIAGQAIVFGRLAGFLTALFPPDADLFRAVSNAVLDGHAETRSLR